MKKRIQNQNIKILPPSSAWLFRPQFIRIGINRSCNFNCLMCWHHSPILKKPKSDAWKRVKIDKDLAIRTIREASEIGFRRILFSGAGEPFIHPNVMDFIEEAAERKLYVIIQTNLLLADPVKLVKALRGVEKKSNICVNLSASSPQTYKEINRNTSKKDFYDVLNKMKFLIKNHIKVRLVYVVTRPDCQGLEEVIRLNKKVGSFLHLELADFTRGGGIESIEINKKEKEEIFKRLSYIKSKDSQTNSNISDFLDQINYKGIGVRKISYCLMGYHFCAINEIGHVHYCFNKSSKFFMGDLNQSSLKQIWVSRKYNNMRKRLQGGKFFKECTNYCTKSYDVDDYRGANFKLRCFINPEIPIPGG